MQSVGRGGYTLEGITHAQIIASAGLTRLQHLQLVATVDIECFFEDVKAGEENSQIVAVVVARADIQLSVCFYVGWVAVRALALANAGKIRIAPVVCETLLNAGWKT